MFTNVEEGNSFSSPGSSIHAVFQARILEWLVIPVSWGSSWRRGQTHFCIAGRFFTIWATREALLMQRPTQWQCFRISGYFICYFIRSENCNASPISCSVYVRIIPSFIKHVAESHLKNLKLIFLLFCPDSVIQNTVLVPSMAKWEARPLLYGMMQISGTDNFMSLS